jgi:hypothetical protein
MLREVNPLHPCLNEKESFALTRMLEKREQYVDQGRAFEAHGAGTMIWILWRALTDSPQQATGYGGLS